MRVSFVASRFFLATRANKKPAPNRIRGGPDNCSPWYHPAWKLTMLCSATLKDGLPTLQARNALLAPPGASWHTFDALPSGNGRLSGKNYWLPTSGKRSSRVAARLTLIFQARGWLSTRLQLPGSHQPRLAVAATGMYSSLATMLYCDVSSILLLLQVVKDSVPARWHSQEFRKQRSNALPRQADSRGH